MTLTAEEQAAIVEALVSARRRISFYEKWRPKGVLYEQQDAEALRNIAAALATLDYEGDDGDGDD